MKGFILTTSIAFVMFISFVLWPEDAAAQAPPAQPDMTLDAATRAQVIDAVLKQMNDRYVFPEIAKQMETSVRGRLSAKEYETITSAEAFAQKLTEDLRAVSRDKHIRVRYSAEKIPVRTRQEEPTAEERARYEQQLKRNNYAFVKVEVMPGNIGYIDLRGFTDPERGAETVAAAMNFVGGTDALIFDLRQNGGGNPAMVALICSYLFGDKPVHLNDLYWREGNRTEEFWTKPEKAARKYDRDVYVLTSNRTFSGAEEFSNNLKVLKRATIIGETTGGGANPGAFIRLHDHFGAFVPTGRAINPVTKTNWEGTGVEPDVKVAKELALKTAYLTALNKSLEKEKEEGYRNALKRLIEQNQKELEEMKVKK